MYSVQSCLKDEVMNFRVILGAVKLECLLLTGNVIDLEGFSFCLLVKSKRRKL